MKFYKKYKDLLNTKNSPYYTMVYTGGRGSGKTIHVCLAVLTRCMQEKTRVCFFRETKATIEEGIKSDLDKLLLSEFKDKGFTSIQNEINHVNGSHIFFKGLKEVNLQALENLKGIATNTDIFVIDEAQAVSSAVLKKLIPTLRNEGSVLIVIYNRIANNLPIEEELFLNYEKMTAPNKTLFVEVNYKELQERGFLSSQFIERAELVKQNRPAEYEEIYLNKVANAKDKRVVKNFTSDNIRPLFYQENLDLHISCDFNVDPMCWVFFHKTKDKLFYFDELIQENTTTPLCANEIIRRYPNHKGNIILNGDASGNFKNVAQSNPDITNFILIKNILEKHYKKEVQIEIRKGNPHIKNRVLAFNELVCDYKGNRRVFFSPSMKWCLYNIDNLLYKEGTSEIDIPTITDIRCDINKKFLSHPFDAFSYPAEYYFPVVHDN